MKALKHLRKSTTWEADLRAQGLIRAPSKQTPPLIVTFRDAVVHINIIHNWIRSDQTQIRFNYSRHDTQSCAIMILCL